MMTWIARTWCKMTHTKAMWPMHGKYICPQCLMEYPVEWESTAVIGAAAPARHRDLRVSTPVSVTQ